MGLFCGFRTRNDYTVSDTTDALKPIDAFRINVLCRYLY